MKYATLAGILIVIVLAAYVLIRLGDALVDRDWRR